jgi:tRNA (adenine22-N1)-methyltransferase
MKLSKRLKAIGDWIEKVEVVGDIGSDHGYLMVYLAENNKIKNGIASDINRGPVKNCQQTIITNDLSERIEVRLGGGFKPFKVGELDLAVIAGMGGELIVDIFIESPEIVQSISNFILQPMTGQEALRDFLIKNNFEIIKEKVIWEDHRCYEMLYVSHPHDSKFFVEDDINVLGLELGFKMQADEAYLKFLDKKIEKYNKIMDNIIRNGDKKHPSYINASQKVQSIKGVKACIQTRKK